MIVRLVGLALLLMSAGMFYAFGADWLGVAVLLLIGAAIASAIMSAGLRAIEWLVSGYFSPRRHSTRSPGERGDPPAA